MKILNDYNQLFFPKKHYTDEEYCQFKPKIFYSKEEYFDDNLKYVKEDILNGTITENCILSINGTFCTLTLYKKRFTIETPTSNIRIKLYD